MKLHFTGGVGGIIQYEVRGTLRVRSYPSHMHNPRTPAQTAHRTRFATASSFVRTIGNVYKLGYHNYNPTLSPRANFVHQVYTTALQPDGTIDPTRALIARGPLTPPLAATATITGNHIQLHWQRPNSRDLQLTATLYNYTRALSQTTASLASSAQTSATLAIPNTWLSDQLYLYLFWHHPTSHSASDSIALTLTPTTDPTTLQLHTHLHRQALTAHWPSHQNPPSTTTTTLPTDPSSATTPTCAGVLNPTQPDPPPDDL